MKKLCSFLCALLLFTACGAQPQSNVNVNEQTSVPKAWEISYQDFTTQAFYEKRGHEPMLVFFYQEACPTCTLLDEALKKEGNNLNGKVTIYKVSFDRELELRNELHVGLPGTVVALNAQGQIVQSQSYVVNFLQVQELIKAILS